MWLSQLCDKELYSLSCSWPDLASAPAAYVCLRWKDSLSPEMFCKLRLRELRIANITPLPPLSRSTLRISPGDRMLPQLSRGLWRENFKTITPLTLQGLSMQSPSRSIKFILDTFLLSFFLSSMLYFPWSCVYMSCSALSVQEACAGQRMTSGLAVLNSSALWLFQERLWGTVWCHNHQCLEAWLLLSGTPSEAFPNTGWVTTCPDIIKFKYIQIFLSQRRRKGKYKLK